jgi:hypothetical protein
LNGNLRTLTTELLRPRVCARTLGHPQFHGGFSDTNCQPSRWKQRTRPRRCAPHVAYAEALGYVDHEGPEFRLTPRVLDLSYIFLATTGLWGTVEPVMEKLVIATQEASLVSVLDGTEIVRVAVVPGPRIMTSHVTIGSRFPAYCTYPSWRPIGARSGSNTEGEPHYETHEVFGNFHSGAETHHPT